VAKLWNLLTARHYQGLTQDELAARSKVSRTAIANIESGRNNAKPGTAKALADALGYEIWQLMSDDKNDLRKQVVKSNGFA